MEGGGGQIIGGELGPVGDTVAVNEWVDPQRAARGPAGRGSGQTEAGSGTSWQTCELLAVCFQSGPSRLMTRVIGR